MSNEKKVKPFGLGDKIGYLFGDFGNDFTFILASSFLLKFYTDVMEVPAAAVGMIMMIARFVDAFTDVAMGRLCDRSKQTKAGKFKPWIMRMSIPVALASFLMYQSSLAHMSLTFKIAYLFVTYILWGSIFYTSINIPYGSMASAISPEASDRHSLSTFRSLGGTFAGVVIGAIIPKVVYENIGDKVVLNGSKFTMVAGLFSVLAVICYFLCYYLITERVVVEVSADKQKENNVFKMLKNAASNRALISLIVASIILLLTQLTMSSMGNYVYPNYYKSTTAQSVSALVMLVAMLLAATISKPLSKKFGKAEVSIGACLFATAIFLFLYIARPQNVWVYVILQTFCWTGLGMFNMVIWALVTDVIDYSEIKNGIREDGAVYALYSFARKIGQAASAGLTGVLLGIVGYTDKTAFDSGVVNGIYDVATLVPVIGFSVLALVLWFWYPLHKKQVEENIRLLKEKHNK